MKMSSKFSFALSLFFLFNLFIEFSSACCCCDCCCCCQQQTMNVNGTTIPMGGGCGCGGGGTDQLLALLLGRRRRRNANLGSANILLRTNALQKGKNSAGGGCIGCVNCEGQKRQGPPEKTKPKQFFSIPAPAAEREVHQQHHHQPANPRFLSIPHSQLKVKRQK